MQVRQHLPSRAHKGNKENLPCIKHLLHTPVLGALSLILPNSNDYPHLIGVETEAQRRQLNCRWSHKQGAPYQPPLLSSEAAETPGSLSLCCCLGGYTPRGFSLAQVAPRCQPSRAPRALHFDFLALQVSASSTQRTVPHED